MSRWVIWGRVAHVCEVRLVWGRRQGLGLRSMWAVRVSLQKFVEDAHLHF